MKTDVIAPYSTAASASNVMRWRADSMAMHRPSQGMRPSPARGSRTSGADLVQQRLGVERVEPEPAGDLLARRLRPLTEELRQQLAGLRVAPPVLADLADQVRAQLRRPDPGAEVVRRVETGVHVGEVVVTPVADPRRFGQIALVEVGVAAVAGEARPEVELEPELRLVAAIEQRLEERRRLRVLPRLLRRQAEVLLVPLRLARDRLDDVRVDLRQRVVARDAAEDVGQRRVTPGVVQRVPGFVQERLIVVQATLRARDQVHDLRRVARDHAG